MPFVFPAIVVACFVLFSAHRVWQRLRARDGYEVMASDPRPPVLFLRSFVDDGAGDTPDDLRWTRREEQDLERIFHRLGPFIAVRHPSTLLPETGAARIVLNGPVWKDQVAELVQRSGLVVVRIGTSAGLVWELRNLVTTTTPDRVVLYLGEKDREARWRAFRKATVHLFPRPLPVDCGDHLFILFDASWVPSLWIRGVLAQPDHGRFINAETRSTLWALLVVWFLLPPLFLVHAVDGVSMGWTLGVSATATAAGVWLLITARRIRFSTGRHVAWAPLTLAALGAVFPPLERYPSITLAFVLLWVVIVGQGALRYRDLWFTRYLAHAPDFASRIRRLAVPDAPGTPARASN